MEVSHSKLSQAQREICLNTVSSNAFYMIVMDALLTSQRISVVRMADGERLFFKDSLQENSESLASPPGLDDTWMKRYGCLGIKRGEIYSRLRYAADNCSYFAPSLSGLWHESYYVHDICPRDRYVDNFFPIAWNEEMKIELFKQARHVLLIHNSVHLADAMQIRARAAFGVKVTWLNLSNWDQSEDIIQKASSINAPLVLFSGGPANKYIGPRIVHDRNHDGAKVVLDIGNAMDRWALNSLQHFKREDADKTPLVF